MTFKPLSAQETATTGLTHMVVLTANDLTQATANTAQVFTVAALPTGVVIPRVFARLITAFQNTADAAFNSCSLSVGDTGLATRWFTTQDINANGTPITVILSATAVQGPYAASQNITVTINSMAAKSLVNINVGELHILFRIDNYKPISDGQPATGITK